MGKLVTAIAVCVVLFAGADAKARHHKGHHHHHHEALEAIPVRHTTGQHQKDAKLESETSDLKAMMEGVKHQTDAMAGVESKPALKEEASPVAPQDDQAVTDGLLKEAAKMKEMMYHHDSPKKATAVVSAVASKANLSSSSESETKSRAARWFAEHGMGNMGKMLGETESAEDARQPSAATLMKRALKMDKEQQELSSEFPDDTSSLDDDDEEASMKAKWAKVDALRSKHLRGF